MSPKTLNRKGGNTRVREKNLRIPSLTACDIVSRPYQNSVDDSGIVSLKLSMM